MPFYFTGPVDIVKRYETQDIAQALSMNHCAGTSIRAPFTPVGAFEDNARTNVNAACPLRSRRDSYTNTLRELYSGVFTLDSVKPVSRCDGLPEITSCSPSASNSVDALSRCAGTSDDDCLGASFMAAGSLMSRQGPDADCATVDCGARDQNPTSNRHNFPRPARMSDSASTPLIPANVSDASQKFRSSVCVGIPGLPHPTVAPVVALIPRGKTSSNACAQISHRCPMNCASAVINLIIKL